jgi:hypothetical protein
MRLQLGRVDRTEHTDMELSCHRVSSQSGARSAQSDTSNVGWQRGLSVSYAKFAATFTKLGKRIDCALSVHGVHYEHDRGRIAPGTGRRWCSETDWLRSAPPDFASR